MTCQDFDDQFDAYARGALRDDAAAVLEQHAAECATCAMRLERLPHVDVSMFAPALPIALREATLAGVRARRAQSTQRKWLGGGLIAAAAVFAVLTIPRLTRGGAGVVASSGDSLVRPPASAAALAADRATTEFEAIDAAERELRTAIAAAPEDAQLRAFLASVNAQREDLRRRVEAAHT